MSRHAVTVRDAMPDDLPALLTVWADSSRRTAGDRKPTEPTRNDGAAAIARIAAAADERLVVAELEGTVAGAAHLVRAPLSPVSGDAAIHVTHLHVLSEFRRHGVGHALFEAVAAWAEEKDTSHVFVAAAVASRDANRFMARLGLAQVAVVRGASVATLRAKLPVEAPIAARVGARSQRNVGQVLAQRRSMRRVRGAVE